MGRQSTESDQYGDRHNVKDYMQRIRRDAIALRQKNVRRSVHHFIARGEFRIRAEEVWNPPRLQRAEARKPVVEPKPPEQPVREASAKVECAAGQSDCNRS